jgi:hypothetical protein
MVLVNQKKYGEALVEADISIGINKKDGFAYYVKGLAKLPDVLAAIKRYADSVQKVNDNRIADPLTRDELRATMEGLDKAATEKRDEIIEIFATAIACGEMRARNELKIFAVPPDDLEKLIQAKKAALGV